MSQKTDNVVAESEAGSGALRISLHPLVIINISDHYTRNKVSNPKVTNPRIIGTLFGSQKGRDVEIFNSFELTFNEVEGKIVIDTEYLTKKQEQFKQVFPTYDLLGWYSTGSRVQTSDIHIHNQIMEFNESPLFLLLDPVASQATRELPIFMYESQLRIIDGNPTTKFVKVNYKIDTGEAERISVDHVAHISPSGTKEGSQLTAQLAGTQNAIKMLNMRIKIIKTFLEATEKGEIPKDHNMLRKINGIVNLLPTIDTPNFKQEFLSEYNDALLVTYLSTITKGASIINELVERYNTAYDKHHRRSRQGW